jgi:hypothetical protein
MDAVNARAMPCAAFLYLAGDYGRCILMQRRTLAVRHSTVCVREERHRAWGILIRYTRPKRPSFLRARMRSMASRGGCVAIRAARRWARYGNTRLAWILPMFGCARQRCRARGYHSLIDVNAGKHRRLRTTASLRARARADAVFRWGAVLSHRPGQVIQSARRATHAAHSYLRSFKRRSGYVFSSRKRTSR